MHYWLFILSMTSAATLTCLVRALALRLRVSPKTDYRRQQQGAIALWGGLGIYLSLGISYLIEPHAQLGKTLFVSSLLIATGLLDDRHELKARSKFIMQIFAALGWLYLNPQPNLLVASGVPPFLAMAISTIWIVGLCNAFNLIDGADGQCSASALLSFIVIAVSFPNLIPIAVPLIGATAGFLLWNFPPAKIYLGEAGSTLLGFCLATMTLTLPLQGSAFATILGALFLAAFPLTDTLLAIVRRKIKKRPIFSGDKDHVHHLLQKLGFKNTKVLLIVAFMVLAGDLTAYNLFRTSDPIPALILTLNCSSLMSFILYGFHYTKKNAAQKLSYFGKSLLDHHMRSLNSAPLNPNSKKAYLIDLLPYYAELQSRGIPTIIRFISEVSAHFKTTESCHLFSVGSYSILAIYENGSNWSQRERDQINSELKRIFNQFSVLKSLSDTPEGVYYFDESNIQVAFEMLSSPVEMMKSFDEPLRAAG